MWSRIDRICCIIAFLNVVDIFLNRHPHLILYLAQQVTSFCSQGTGANLPTEYVLFWLLLSKHKRLETGGERISNPTISINRRTPPYARTHTRRSPLITLLCSLWVSKDKQCDDQRPLITRGGQGLICLWKGLKETSTQYLRNGNEKRKTYNKGLFYPHCGLVAVFNYILHEM